MPHSKGHILIVEPNDITRKLIAGILSNRGYETWEAPDGDAALAFLGKSPTLVIVDIDLEEPGIMGFLRKMQMSHSRLPLVAMSEEQDTAALKARLGLKAISVLQKPVVPENLISNVENHLVRGVDAEVAAHAAAAHSPPGSDPGATERRAGFMRRAIDLAQEKMDENCGGPFGAVVVRGGKIIGEGWNEVTSGKDPTAHAEIVAIRAAARAAGDYDLSGCEIYASCEPCPMCLAAIYWARIDRVFYAGTREDAAAAGFDDEYIHRELVQPENKRALPSRMMLRDEARIVFESWTKKSDKTMY